MSKSTLKKIHVNQHVIRTNGRDGLSDPVFTIKNRGKTITAASVKIDGPSELIYSPSKPLSCGAKVWISTKSPVEVYRGESLSEPIEVLI